MSDPVQPSVLIVEDDTAMRGSLIELMDAAGWRVDAVARATKVDERLVEFQPDVILSDVRMPGMSGLELLASLDPGVSPPLVLISAHGDIPMAVQAMQNGAYSFVEKPYEPRRLINILAHAAEQSRMKEVNARLRDRLVQLSGLNRVLMGETREIAALRRDILDLADADMAVMVLGETGTGKEVVARALHDLGHNPGAPFVALNCAALGSEAFDAEMFGVSGGQKGHLLAASGGTLFLDEVASCPLSVQAKLLRVIEEQQVIPTGGSTPIHVSFRVVSATNENVDEAVAEGRLRQDLLFRLNTVVLDIPPLRQRRDDLTLLAVRFLAEFAETYETAPPDMSQDDLAVLLAHDWPGNVRELRSVAERRVLAARRGSGTMSSAIRADSGLDDVPETLREAVAAFERELIGKAIKANEGRMDATAEALGIGRRTLNDKIVKLGLDKDALV